MITNIARAFRWQALIDSGKFSNVHELARAIGKDDAYVSRIIRFTLLAPEIIHAVLAGKISKSISTEKLKQSLPILWEEQKKMGIVVKNVVVLMVKYSVTKTPQSQNCQYTPIVVVHGEKQRQKNLLKLWKY